MQRPTLFKLISDNPELYGKLSYTSGTRTILGVYEFGVAPDSPNIPYVVWTVLGGVPYLNFDSVSQSDRLIIQIDVYAKTGSETISITNLIRSVIEMHCHVIDIRGIEKQQDGTFSYSFDVSWHVKL